MRSPSPPTAPTTDRDRLVRMLRGLARQDPEARALLREVGRILDDASARRAWRRL